MITAGNLAPAAILGADELHGMAWTRMVEGENQEKVCKRWLLTAIYKLQC